MSIAWVLSGGGAACAHTVGVIAKLAANGVRPEKLFGVSAGAIVAAQYAFDGVEKLKADWEAVKGPEDFFKKSSVLTLLWNEGYYSAKPLEKRLSQVLEPGKLPFMPVEVGYTDLTTGKMVYVSTREPRIVFKEAVLASASLPVIMETVGGKVDGGLIDITPLSRAIDQGFTEIYVFLASPLKPDPRPWKMKWPYPINIAKRTIEIMMDEVWRNDLKICQLYNEAPWPFRKRRVKLHIYEHNPRQIDTLEFTNADIKKAIAKGEAAKCLICGT